MDGEKGRRLNTNVNVPDDRDSSHDSSLPREQHDSPNNTKSHTPIEASAVDSPESTKHPSDVSGESLRPTDSPPIQVMERTESASGSGRWSDESNDSLFSIRMGNDSLTKEVSLRLSGDMCTSGELSLSEAYLPRTGESPASRGKSEASKEAKANEADESGSEASINYTDSNRSTNPDASHHHSDQDNKSRNDALVKALNGGSSCPLCRCSCCGKMDCCSRLPSCKLGWPSCCSSNCLSWPSYCSRSCCSNSICGSCYNWNRESKRPRSDSTYSLMEKGAANSTKHKTES